MTTTAISNTDDILDSRDIIARIETLRDERDSYQDNPEDGASKHTWAGNNPDDATELAALEALADEAHDYAPDWQHGETLIRDSYFERYAQELADDIGATNREISWPHTCIDWEQAARELQMDYTAVDFDGVTYWVR